MAFRANTLVNKQFNSPIKLYSPTAVAEAMEKQKQVLANGAVGVDFHHLAKPGNLANSAVLRMLEEEERSGRKGVDDPYKDWIERYWDHALVHPIKEIKADKLKKWSVHPPRRLYWEPRESPITVQIVLKKYAGVKRVAWPPPLDQDTPPENQQPSPIPGQQSNASPAPLSPQPARRFQPINSPSPSHQQPQETSHHNQRESPYQSPIFHPVKFEPPKTIVQLRPSPPIRQAPSPVYQSQPVAATVQGGQRMRGDQKWPPEAVKQQSEAENIARIALAKGPACRPRKVQKDYRSFFAQHALTSTYPGYRVPPGTQHYQEGTSDL